MIDFTYSDVFLIIDIKCHTFSIPKYKALAESMTICQERPWHMVMDGFVKLNV